MSPIQIEVAVSTWRNSVGTRGMESVAAIRASPESAVLFESTTLPDGGEQLREDAPKAAEREIPWSDLLGGLDRTSSSLQSALRNSLADSILQGRLPPGTRLPSTRVLASQLRVARITVSMAYDALELEGLVVVRQRSGHYVARRLWPEQAALHEPAEADLRPNWASYFPPLPQGEKRLERPRQWQKYRFPFVYGQADQELFPLADWRECSRLAQATPDSSHWSSDEFDSDDPFLVEQLCSNLLPQRGITASPDEVLITMGSQMGAYLLSELLVRSGSTVAFEDPGYTEARNLFLRREANLLPMVVDEQGAVPPETLEQRSLIYLTPSHQCPTGATLATERRTGFLELARRTDSLIVEDDYDSQADFQDSPAPALKASDQTGHVLYLGSFSKIFAPGLRLGYLVADRDLIERARHLRRLIIRHTPGNNQRALALFLARGHYERLSNKYRAFLQEKAHEISETVRRYLPTWQFREPQGGSALWVQGPSGTDMTALAVDARRKGLLLESGESFFQAEQPPKEFARLAYSTIDRDLIEPGIRLLAQLVWEQRNRFER